MFQGALIIWAVAGPLIAGGGMYATMRMSNGIVTAAAVSAEAFRQVAICQRQLTDQITTLEANTMSGIGAAGAAADAVQPTPVSEFQIKALCEISPECRSRGATQ